MTHKAVVMVGNISDGWVSVGPFDSWEDACEWADKSIAESMTWIETVYSPEEFFIMEELKTN